MKQVSFGSRDLSNADTGWLRVDDHCSKSTTAFSGERAPRWPLLALEYIPPNPCLRAKRQTQDIWPRPGRGIAHTQRTRYLSAASSVENEVQDLGRVCARCLLPFGLRSMPVTLRERHPRAPIRPHRNAAPTPLSCPSPTKLQYAQGPASSPRGSTRTTSPCPSAAGLEAWCLSEVGTPKDRSGQILTTLGLLGDCVQGLND